MHELRWRRLSYILTLSIALEAAGSAEAASQLSCGLGCTLVEVVVAKSEAYAAKVTLTGSIDARFSSKIAFRTSGKIERRLAEIGDHIAADQVLARLDPQVQRANLDSAKAAVTSAQALLSQATATFERQEQLLKSGFTTRQSYDQAQQQLRTQQAAVESAKAAASTAEEQLGYTELRAGVAGIITARSAETGQVVQAGQTVFTVAHEGARDAVFDVYETLLNKPPAGRAQIFLQADPTVVTTGTVREISPTVDPTSGTVKVKIALDSVPAQMSLGAVVVGVGSFKPRPAIILPRSALFRWQDSPAVWLFEPKTRTVMPKVITIDRYAEDKLILSGGVSPGDSVVTAGIQFLRPEQVVELANSGTTQ